MRTRSTSSLLHPAYTLDTVQNYVGTKKYDANGLNVRLCLPPVPDGARWTDTTVSLVGIGIVDRSETSVITDDTGRGRPIRACSHVKRKNVVYPAVDYVRSASWLADRYPLPGENVNTITYPYVSALARGHRPAYLAWTHGYSPPAGYAYNVNTVTAAQLALTTPPDRLGELPSQVISRIQSLQLGVTAGELRDFPKLAKLFTIRGAFKGATWVQVFAKRYVFSSQGRKAKIKELLAAYRNGHLGVAFGLMPTVSEVIEIYNEVRSPKKRPKSTTFVVTLKGSSSRNHTASTSSAYHKSTHQTIVATERIDGVRVTHTPRRYASDTFKWLDGHMSTLKRYAGQNPLGIIWELFPLSFCVDWLLSVDKVIDSLWLQNQSEFKCEYWSSTTTQFSRECYWSYPSGVARRVYPTPIEYTFSGGEQLHASFREYIRTPRQPPGLLQSVRTRGANISNVYLAILIALGLRGK